MKRVVKQVSKEIMADPVLAKGIIEPLKSQGVAAMGDFAIQVKMKFMAKPGEQFVVRRAIYDRIKKAFATNGIKFAFPTVSVAGGEGGRSRGGTAHDGHGAGTRRGVTRPSCRVDFTAAAQPRPRMTRRHPDRRRTGRIAVVAQGRRP